MESLPSTLRSDFKKRQHIENQTKKFNLICQNVTGYSVQELEQYDEVEIDSLQLAQIIIEVHNSLPIRFSASELEKIKSFQDLKIAFDRKNSVK